MLFLSQASQLLFITLGVDQFVAITSPYHHNNIMTNKIVVSVYSCSIGIIIRNSDYFASDLSFLVYAKCSGPKYSRQLCWLFQQFLYLYYHALKYNVQLKHEEVTW